MKTQGVDLRSRLNQSLLLKVIIMLLITTLLSPATSCTKESTELKIFAAAGAKPVIDDICQLFQNECSIGVEVTYGGGGEVLSQMVLTESGDLYIAPEQSFISKAEEKRAIVPDTIASVAYMIPVIAVSKGNPDDIHSLDDLSRPGIQVGVTRPETTLLGKYALEIFAKSGFYEEIENNIIVEATRPDNLLTMLLMEQIDACILWHFYAAENADKIENIYLLPEQLTGIGEMQIAITTYCSNTDTAQDFIDFLTSSDGKTVFGQLGYIVNDTDAREYWQ